MPIDALLGAVKSAGVKTVVQHWSEARGTRLMPAWSDIQPSRIAAQLPFVWAYSYDAVSDSFMGRLAGDRIEAIFGRSFRHTPLSEVFPPHEYADVFARAKRVIDEPAIFHGAGLVFRQLNRHGHGERIILPLASDGLHGDGLLGCTEYRSIDGPDRGSLSQTDRWFAL